MILAASTSNSSRSQRACWEAEGKSSLLAVVAPVKQVASFAVPAGVFVVVTFGMKVLTLLLICCEEKSRGDFRL